MSKHDDGSGQILGKWGTLATIVGTLLAAIALIPAFGQWLFPERNQQNQQVVEGVGASSRPFPPTSQPTTTTAEPNVPAQAQSVLSKTTSPAAAKPGELQSPPEPPSGNFACGRPIGELRVRGYGQEQVQLVLEHVENQPSSALTLHFLLDNRKGAPYEIALLDPDNNVFVTDSQGAEHPYRSVTDMSELEPLQLASLSRHRFSITFTPLVSSGDSIVFRGTFKVIGRGSFPSREVCKIEVDDIRLNRPM